jgi:Spy/CpxP family protein refolding chaperone
VSGPGSVPPGRKEPTVGGGRRSQTGASTPLDQLKAAQVQLDEAIITEGIEPSGPLGVWASAQRAMIAAIVSYMEDHTARVETKAQSVEASMRAEVDRVKVTNDAARVETMRLRSQGDLLKEERLKAGDDLAIRMSDKIQEHLKDTVLVREKRWNLFHNLRLVAMFAGVLFAVFLGGQWTVFHGDRRDILERCQASPAIDPVTKVAYCPMWAIEGLPDPIPPSAAPARR